MNEELREHIIEVAKELVKTKLSVTVDVKESYYAKDLIVTLKLDDEEINSSSYTFENKM